MTPMNNQTHISTQVRSAALAVTKWFFHTADKIFWPKSSQECAHLAVQRLAYTAVILDMPHPTAQQSTVAVHAPVALLCMRTHNC